MGFRALLWTNLRMDLRNKSSLFFHFAFPIIFMVIFGLIFGKGNINLTIGISTNDSKIIKTFNEAFKKNENVKIVKGNVKKLVKELKDGDLNTVVEFKDNKNPKSEPTNVVLYYDPSKQTTSQTALSIVESTLDGVTQKIFKVPTIFKIDKKSVAAKNLDFMGFLMPGILGMSIMFSAIMGTATPIITEREKGILRRLRLTLIKPIAYIGAKSVGMVIIAFIQSLIIIGVAVIFFDIAIVGSYLTTALIVLIGCLMLVALGFVVAGLSTTSESVDAISNAIAIPMMFLSASFFPIDGAPKWLRLISDFLPLTYLNEALRDVLIRGKAFSDIYMALIAMLVWIAIFLVLAVMFFKWEVKPDQ